MFFTRKRVKWSVWDFSLFILPFGSWIFLILINSKGKGIGNMVEGLIIGVFVPLTIVLRSLIKDKLDQKIFAQWLLILLCLAAVGIYAFMPGFPE